MKVRYKEHLKGREESWRAIIHKVAQMNPCVNLACLYDIMEDESAFYIIMESCNGGELFRFLLTEAAVTERECKRIMTEILRGVNHLHSCGFIHRDIKPENILFKQDAKSERFVYDYCNSVNLPANTLKLIDFDTCQEFDVNTGLAKRCRRIIGTLGYIAPESYLGEYSRASDMFSVGVILYILMTGDMPFDDSLFEGGNNNIVGSPQAMAIHRKLTETAIDWTCSPWSSYPKALDLCKQLLAINPQQRVQSAAAALQHPWLADNWKGIPRLSNSTCTSFSGSISGDDSSDFNGGGAFM